MKKISAVFEIDSDLAEYKLRNHLDYMGAKYVKTLPNTDHLKDNTTFKKLVKAKKSAQAELSKFINDNRNG